MRDLEKTVGVGWMMERKIGQQGRGIIYQMSVSVLSRVWVVGKEC